MSGNLMAERALVKLSKYYLHDDIEELVINRPGEVWVKPRRQDWHPVQDDTITYDYLLMLCRILANINHSKFSEGQMPVVSCELPGQPFRFQAVVGNNVRYDLSDRKGCALSIRSLKATNVDFHDYGLTEDAKLPGATARYFEGFDLGDGHLDSINKIIESHQSIIVSGATSTGKTTFTNRVIKLLHDATRIITVEDTRELDVIQKNKLHFVYSRNKSTNEFGINAIINALMRLTPDWILMGELSVENAEGCYNLLGKGHPIITTVHSSTPEEAIRAFVNNMSASGSKLDPVTTAETIKSSIGCIIQLDYRRNEETGARKRMVTDIVFPAREIAQQIALEKNN